MIALWIAIDGREIELPIIVQEMGIRVFESDGALFVEAVSGGKALLYAPISEFKLQGRIFEPMALLGLDRKSDAAKTGEVPK